ncbi:hypothetical protein ABZW10_29885 [Kitasatospora sp. NPDC004723]
MPVFPVIKRAAVVTATGIVGIQTGSEMQEVIVHNEFSWGTTCWENLPTW